MKQESSNEEIYYAIAQGAAATRLSPFVACLALSFSPPPFLQTIYLPFQRSFSNCREMFTETFARRAALFKASQKGISGGMKLKRGLGRPRGRLVQRDLISFLYYLLKASSQPRIPITIEHVQQPLRCLFSGFFFFFFFRVSRVPFFQR